jgi:hypothetical protein
MSEPRETARPGIQHRSEGRGDPPNIAAAINTAREAGRSVRSVLGDTTSSHLARRVVGAFRREMIPPARPGRKKRAVVTAAVEDWEAGLRGVQLYEKHILGWSKMSHWRRRIASDQLRDAIATRRRRERQSQHEPTPP